MRIRIRSAASSWQTVDSHQHYWQLHRFDYGWIDPKNVALHQDRTPADLQPHMHAAGIERSVFVHATNTPAEIEWMLRLCDKYPYIAGVVGWVDLTAPDVGQRLAHFARDQRFKGVRLSLPYDEMNRSALDAGLNALGAHQLACDLLGDATVPQAFPLVLAHPNVTFVLDHLAGAHITAGGEITFARSLTALARLPNTVMKLSGYLTASAGVPRHDVTRVLQSYVNVALELFGPGRLMFGSDWPVCTMAGTYSNTVDILREITPSLDSAAAQAIWGGTATRTYALG